MTALPDVARAERRTVDVARAYTVATLAEAWGCSDELVYGLCKSGALPGAFKLGQKLWRIPPATVEEYECQQAIESAPLLDGDRTGPNTGTARSRGLTSEDRTASRLERMIEQPRRPQLVHSGHGKTSPQPIQSAR